MLEVYDRVVMSRNLFTLVMLALISLLLIWVLGLLNGVRQEVLNIQSKRYFEKEKAQVFDCGFLKSVHLNQPYNTSDIDQLNNLSQFIASPVLIALIDLPFALIFLLLIYSMSITFGHLTLLLGLAVALMSWLNEKGVHGNLKEANRLVHQSQTVLNNIVKNSEVIQAMRMSAGLQSRWLEKHFEYLDYHSKASLISNTYQTISRFLQQLLGSIILGVGSWLLIMGKLDVGASGMIVASILAARFVAPFVQILTGWKNIVNAFDAYGYLAKLKEDYAQKPSQIELPPPTGKLLVENVAVKVPFSEQYIIKQVGCYLEAGQSLGVIGPSGSGKTTLAKLLIGAKSADAGSVRLDGADLFTWDKQSVGQYVGYMPQELEFYEGTIAKNIARFAEFVDEEEVNKALAMVGLTEYIAGLENGIHNAIQANSNNLPGGKRQLLALARAIYKSPRLVVLDEPSSNLDQMGQLAFKRTLAYLKQVKTTVVLITHQKEYLLDMDFLMLLVNGEVKLSGPTQEVLKKLSGNQPAPQPAQGAPK